MTVDLKPSRHPEKHTKRKTVDQHQQPPSLNADAQSPEEAVLPEAQDQITSGPDDKTLLTSLHNPIAPDEVNAFAILNCMEFDNIDALWMTGPALHFTPNISQSESSSQTEKSEGTPERSPCNDSDVINTASYYHEARFPANTLHTAVQKGNDSIVGLLLKHGANSNSKDTDGSTTLLHATIGER